MTQVRRVKNYFVYLVALAISGLFSLLGRSAPTWAEETTAQRNATVFHQTIQVAQQGSVQNRLQRPAPGIERDIKLNTSNIERPADSRVTYMDMNAVEARPFLNKTFSIDKDVSPAWINSQNERFNFMVNSIKDKVERGENLNDIELLYFNLLFKDYVEQKVNTQRWVD